MARVATLAAVALLAACAGAGSLEKDIEKMQVRLVKMEQALRAKKAALADEKALAAKLEAMADAVEMAANAAGDTLDPATPYPTPLVGEHGYAFVVVDFLRYCLEFLGACCSLYVVFSFFLLLQVVSTRVQYYKSMGWSFVAFVFFVVAAYGTSAVVIFRYVIFRYALSYLGTPSSHVGQVRLFLDIAGVIAIYFMSPASRTYPGTAIYFMFWTAIYSYFGL